MMANRIDDATVEQAASLVRARTGLVFRGVRRNVLLRYVADDLRRRRARDPQRYLELLDNDRAVFDDLVAAMTVGETYFGRDPAQLALIRDDLVPTLEALRGPRHALRIWSAGCATGEEPYTLAIMARDAGLDPMPSIIGTDISRVALARAARGRYGRWCFRGLDASVRDRHFRADGAAWLLAPALRRSVSFSYLNLAEDAYPSLACGIYGMDLILCRNVLIYFDAETVARVQQRLMASLADGGMLVLGAADPMMPETPECEPIVTAAGVIYRKRRARPRAVTSTTVTTSTAVVHDAQASFIGSPRRTDRRPTRPRVRSTAARATRAVPRTEPVALQALEARYAERDYSLVAALASRVVGDDETRARAATLQVRALANLGDLEAAGRCCTDAVERHRDRAELLYLQSVILAEAGRHVESARAARSALYLDRGLIVAHLATATARARLGDRTKARAAFRRAERLLAELPPHEVVPASDGEPAAALAELVRVRLSSLEETA